MKSALVVLSGGQDSTTCLFKAIHTPEVERIECVTFDYGQRHTAEITAAHKVCQLAAEQWVRKIPHEIKILGPIFEGRSPLTARDQNLEVYADITEMNAIIQNRVELTFVPGRNAVFATLAYSYAVARELDAIILGVSQEDAANYPDCRESFFITLGAAMRLATNVGVKIKTPLMFRSKKQTVELAMTLPGCMDALAYSHTAYSGEFPPVTQDHATVLRAHGFQMAGQPDPLIVRAWKEGKMALPDTSNYDHLRSSAQVA
jgi:7-cyano-7-deazaguanine synthase